jgi:putative oxidoreductase
MAIYHQAFLFLIFAWNFIVILFYKIMSPSNGKELFHLVLRVGLGGLFLYSGGMKLFGTGLDSFVKDVDNFHIVSSLYSVFIAYSLPWLELFVGVFLLLGFFTKAAASWALLMTLVFIIAIASAWIRGIDLHCGCFGKSTESVNYPSKMMALLIQLAYCFFLLFKKK